MADVLVRAPVGIFQTDETGQCIDVNERWCSMTGLTREQARGRGWVLAIHPADRERVLAEWDCAVREKREFMLEYRYCAGDRVTWVLGQATAVRDAAQHVVRYVGTATDITRSKNAESMASRAASSIRQLFDQLPEAVIVHRFGPIVFANVAATRALGYSLDELKTLHIRDIVHPSERERVQQRIQWLEDRHESVNERRMTRMLRKDGSVSLFEVTAVRSEYELRPAVIAMFHDMNAHFTREAHLRASLECLPDAFFILECERDVHGGVEDFRIAEVNEALKRLFGQTRSALVGERLSSVLEASLFQTLFPTYRDVHQLAEPMTQELELASLKRWVRHQVLPLPNGVTATFHDITEQRLAQERLRESEERWQFALEGTNQGVWDWNVETGEVFFSKRFKSMLGYEDHEFANLFEEWSSRVHAEDWPHVWNEVERHMRGDTASYEMEFRMLRKDGSYAWILDRGRIVSWTDTCKPRRMVGTHTDITNIKQTESLLRQSLAEKEVLLKEVHHRVKNNLQITSSLLRLQAVKVHDRAAQEVLQECQGRVHSIALLHERLYQTPDLSNIDLAEYTESLVGDLRRTLGSERIEVNVEAEPVWVELDIATPYSLVLNELVTNAFKHAFPEKAGKLEIRLRPVAEQVELSVRDNGVGLPAELVPAQSASLGMTLVRMLAKQLRGKVSLENLHGTVATLRFPRHIA